MADRLTAWTGAAVVAALGVLVSAAGIGLAMAMPEPIPAIVGFSLVGAGTAVLVPLAFSAAANLGRTGTALVVVTDHHVSGWPHLPGATRIHIKSVSHSDLE